MRINQYIAKHAGISRRKADELIQKGLVKINGNQAQLAYYIQEVDKVEIFHNNSWKSITDNGSFSPSVLLVYKPPKIMTTSFDPEGRKTIYSILPSRFSSYKTAGRLDFMSEGLIVMSPNGHLILSLTHPKFKTKKKYLVGLQKPLTPQQIKQSFDGKIFIDNYKLNSVLIQKYHTRTFEFLRLEKGFLWYIFELSEGRNRQIRKMATYFNNSVKRLIRVAHGEFELTENVYKKGFIESKYNFTKP